MKTGDIIRNLITCDNYAEVRMGVTDEFIDFVKTFMPRDYDYFREKEEIYQDVSSLLKAFAAENNKLNTE